jgi:hypothetical protein
LLANIVQELLAPTVLNSVTPEYLRDLFVTHRGNIRAALRELYDRAAAPINSLAQVSWLDRGRTSNSIGATPE